MKVGLVACAAQKLARAAPAKDLYVSQLFRAARAYCEAHYDRWYVLSALHGLVEPDTILEPYNVTLNGMSPAEVYTWNVKVLAAMREAIPHDAHLFVHAGKNYRGWMAGPFIEGCPWWLGEAWIDVPLEGLGIGQQLAWYAREARKTLSDQPALL